MSRRRPSSIPTTVLVSIRQKSCPPKQLDRNHRIYNGDGDRISQTVGTVTTTYVLDTATPLTMVLAETTSGVTTRYWHGLDTLAQSDGTTTQYFAYDGLGSVRQLVDATGSVGLAQTFDPYGNGYASAGSAASSLGFTGEQTDSNGFVFLRARYYQPGMGRFTQMDPSRQERNAYLYSAGNPVMFTDPSGLICVGDQYYAWPFPKWTCEGNRTASKEFESIENQLSDDPSLIFFIILQIFQNAGNGALGIEAIQKWFCRQNQIMNYKDYYSGEGGTEDHVRDILTQSGELFIGYMTFLDILTYFNGIGVETTIAKQTVSSLDNIALEIVERGTFTTTHGEAVGYVITSDGWVITSDGMAFPIIQGGSGGGSGAAAAELTPLLVARIRQLAGFADTGTPLIVDESVTIAVPGALDALRAKGYNVRSVNELFHGQKGISDPEIRRLARQIDALVVTMDKGSDLGGGFAGQEIRIPGRSRLVDTVMRYVEEALR